MDRARRLSAGAGLIGGAGAAACALYGVPAVARAADIRELARRCGRRGALALTYDDGPGADLTPRVLERLGRRGARATFFALGRRAAEGAALLDRIVADGHEVACHSHDHLDAWATAPWRAVGDLDRGYAALAPWLAADAPYRPPHGRPTLPVWAAARRRGAPLAWWTLDSGDTSAVLPDPAGRVAALEQAGGGVVLLHDFDRTGPEAERRAEHVLATTELALDLAARRGWSVVSAGELLARGGRASLRRPRRPAPGAPGARARPA